MSAHKINTVGAGPAGYSTTQAFQNKQTNEPPFAIGMIERVPKPWGIVRSGVAQDYPEMKSAIVILNSLRSVYQIRFNF